MWKCASCGTLVYPGCRGVPGADGFLSTQADEDGAVRPVAYHWRRECSGQQVASRGARGI